MTVLSKHEQVETEAKVWLLISLLPVEVQQRLTGISIYSALTILWVLVSLALAWCLWGCLQKVKVVLAVWCNCLRTVPRYWTTVIPIPTHDLFHYMFIKHLTVLTVRAEPDDAVSHYFVIQTKSYQNRNSRHNGCDVFISGTQGTQSNAITMPGRVIKNSTFFKRVISKCTHTGFWT